MKIRILTTVTCLALLIGGAVSSYAALEINNSTNTPTATNATVWGNLVGTNGTNPTVSVFYGLMDGGTSSATWSYSNVVGISSTGMISSVLTNLTPTTYHYFRWQAYESTNEVWASVASNFTTLSRTPTSYPSPSNSWTMMAGSNGNILFPTNLFIANSNLLEEAISGIGYLTEAHSIAYSNLTYSSILQSMTNWTTIASSSNYLVYDPVTRILSGCVTNSGAGTITNMLSSDGSIVWTTPGGAEPDGSVTNYVQTELADYTSEGTYPVIKLPLGGSWTDFELKASTNNFTNLVYYYISSATNATADDTNVWVYFTDDYRTNDVRQWLRQDPIASNIYDQLSDPYSEVESVYVYPSHDCKVAWSNWMIKGNTNLIWSYVRFDGIDFEKNYDDSLQHWSAIQPIEWVTSRLYIDIVSGMTNASSTNRVFAADPWTTSTLDGTNGTYHDSGTNRYWILMP